MAPALGTAPLSLVEDASPSLHLCSPLSVWVRLSAKVPTLTQSQGDWMFTSSCLAVLCLLCLHKSPNQSHHPHTHCPLSPSEFHESREGPGHLHKEAHVWI